MGILNSLMKKDEENPGGRWRMLSVFAYDPRMSKSEQGENG
jgi:hypothetical protein